MMKHEAADPDLLVAYRLRTVRIGVQTTFMTLALLVALPFVPGHPPIDTGPYAALLAVAALGGVVVAVAVPWPHLFAIGWGEWAMYAWSALDVVLVTLGCVVTGGPRSDVAYLFTLTTVFFAASYPGREQVALFALTAICYLALAGLWDPRPPAAMVFIRLGSVAVVWFISSFLSRERTDEMSGHLRSRRLAEHRADLLAAVARTAASITTLDSDKVMAGVTDSLIDLGFDMANFCVLEEGGRRYRVRHARGLPASYTEGVHATGLGMVALVTERRGPVLVRDYGTHPLAVPVLRDLGVRAVIAAPVWVDAELAAVLVAAKTSSPELPTSDAEVFEILAAQVGRALESARRFEAEQAVAERASEASLRDELTGVGNRRRVNALLDGLRPGDALLLIDLDHFKDVNDERGHAAGDEVLVIFGQFLLGRVRDADDVARYGGEEFLVIFRNAGDAALATAERLHEGWRELHPTPTFSAGVAVHGIDHPATITIGQADAALYAAKQMGRDRICAYDPNLDTDLPLHGFD
jgi:diguanylate cyclase (GGDEF)-like protein